MACRCATTSSFTIAWSKSDDPNLSFVVLRDGKYFEVRGALRERWQSGVFVSYDWRRPI